MRLAFAGTPEFAKIILSRLVLSEHEILRVITQPAKKAGRGRIIKPGAVESFGSSSGITVHTPKVLDDSVSSLFADIDVLVVAAYGLILPESVLKAPPFGCFNVHPSLLPRWRGAAPIERTIMHGDTVTGVTIMQMDAGLDTGPIYAEKPINVSRHTGQTMTIKLAELGGDLLMSVLSRIENGESPKPIPQENSLATYAKKITDSDSIIRWTNSAREIDNQIRALSDRQAAYAIAETDSTLRIRILESEPINVSGTPGKISYTSNNYVVGCGHDSLILKTIQLNRGKGKPTAITDAVNGYPFILGAGAAFRVD